MENSKFQNAMMKYLMPIANRLEQQKHLQAVKDGMVSAIPVIIVGSICLLPLAFMNLLSFGPIYNFLEAIYPYFARVGTFTNDILSLYVVYLIARSLAKSYDIYSPQVGICAIAVQLVLVGGITENGINIAYLGASGIFVAIIAGLLTVEITRLLINKKIYIRLPESVPEMVGDSFASLIPLVVNLALATLVATLSMSATGKVFPELIMGILAPAVSSMDTLGALVIVIFLTQLLWFFGLHGPSITSAVWAPFAIAYASENIAAYQVGTEVTHIFTFGMYYNILQVTGSGLTLGLVIFALMSKSKAYKAIGKAAIVPSLFGINEPVIFGLPILLNPFMFIPFVFGPVLISVLTYIAMKTGIIGLPIANPPGFMPPGVGAFLMTFDWRAVVFVFLILILMAVFYYPFFKMMERQQIEKEIES